MLGAQIKCLDVAFAAIYIAASAVRMRCLMVQRQSNSHDIQIGWIGCDDGACAVQAV